MKVRKAVHPAEIKTDRRLFVGLSTVVSVEVHIASSYDGLPGSERTSVFCLVLPHPSCGAGNHQQKSLVQ